MKKSYFYLTIVTILLIFDKTMQNLVYGPLYPFIENINTDPNFPSVVAIIIEILVIYPIYKKFFAFDKKIADNGLNLKLWHIVLIVLGINGFTSLWMIFTDKMDAISSLAQSASDFESAMDTVDESSLFMNLIFSALLGPILEELLFRGVVFSGAEKIFNTKIAILISGILFGLWHGVFVQIVYAAIAGIIFGYIYAKTRKLYLLMIIHIINNFISSIMPYLPNESLDSYFQIISIISIPFFIHFIYKLEKDKKVKSLG